MTRCFGGLLTITMTGAQLLHGASVEAYMTAFEREAQRLASAREEFLAGRVGTTGHQDLSVESYTVPGVQRPGDVYHIRGRVFLPGASLSAVTAVARDYGNHSRIFGPRIAASAVCDRPDTHKYVYRYWTNSYRDSVSETEAVHRQHDDSRYSITTALTGIGGTGDVPGRDGLCRGALQGVSYMKDLRAIWRYEQVKAGVWVESDMVAVLGGFGFVKAIARRSLKQLLEDGLKGWKRRFIRSR